MIIHSIVDVFSVFFIKRQQESFVFNDNLDIATPHSQRENLDNFCYPDPADGVAVVGNKCCLSCPSCRLIKTSCRLIIKRLSFTTVP